MASQQEIIAVIKAIKKASRNFQNTALMEVASVPESTFQVLVSCLISLRTKDAVTAQASKRLYAAARTPEEIAALPEKTIAKLIYPCGFYRTKAKRIKEIARIIHEQYDDRVPDTMEELLKLKGVGRKTANIVLVYGYGKEGLPIDVHCHRVPNRLGWIQTKTPEKTEEELRKLLPKKQWHDFNDLFVSFGQNICKPVKPHCWECPVTQHCRYYTEVYVKKAKK
ncbi:MAG: endonuclease III [Candidatus Aenigmarchaeota archaeon]|nr:endonuclease III [Candidatus Aenigmarchaeota archaeon]